MGLHPLGVALLVTSLAAGCSSQEGGGLGAGGFGEAGGGGHGGGGGAAGEPTNGGGPVESCVGASHQASCEGPFPSFCINQICMIGDCAEAEEWAHCNEPGSKDHFLGFCQAGTCVPECSVLEEGDGCHRGVFTPDVLGVCTTTRYGTITCEPRCVVDADCNDSNDCTVDRCLADGSCEGFSRQDGTLCAGGACQDGECNLDTLEMPCTEQGMRNAARVGGGPFTFDCSGPHTIVVDYNRPITVKNDVSMDGGGNLLIRSSGGPDGVVFVKEHVVAELERMTLAGIDNYGTLTLRGSLLNGGFEGFDNHGMARLTNCTVSGNENDGVANRRDAMLSLTNTTISGNGYEGREAVVNEGTLLAANTLLDGLCWTGPGSLHIASLGYNIESFQPSCPECEGNSCGLDHATDQVNVGADDLQLGPLSDNGGPTETHALGEGSVAIDIIALENCVDAEGAPLTTDQRGVTRPQGDACDSGAVEMEVTQ